MRPASVQTRSPLTDAQPFQQVGEAIAQVGQIGVGVFSPLAVFAQPAQRHRFAQSSFDLRSTAS
jgi:hypothetical protein